VSRVLAYLVVLDAGHQADPSSTGPPACSAERRLEDSSTRHDPADRLDHESVYESDMQSIDDKVDDQAVQLIRRFQVTNHDAIAIK
jgi:hypothetical protein